MADEREREDEERDELAARLEAIEDEIARQGEAARERLPEPPRPEFTRPTPTRAPERQRRREERGEAARRIGLASTVGVVLVGPIVLTYLLGSWLDRALGTAFLMPILVLLGIAAGFVQFVRTVQRLDRDD